MKGKTQKVLNLKRTVKSEAEKGKHGRERQDKNNFPSKSTNCSQRNSFHNGVMTLPSIVLKLYQNLGLFLNLPNLITFILPSYDNKPSRQIAMNE